VPRLDAKGFAVRQADRADDAIRDLRSSAYDLAFFDAELGLSAVAEASVVAPNTNLVVVLDADAEAAAFVVRGAFGVLRRPVRDHEIEAVLTRARSSGALFRASQAVLRAEADLPRRLVEAAREIVAADAAGLVRVGASGEREVALAVGAFDVPLEGDAHVISWPVGNAGSALVVQHRAGRLGPRDADLVGVLAAQLRLALDNERLAAQSRYAALGQVVASVSHEIRNPLTYVLASCDEATTLAEEMPDADALRKVLEDVSDGTHRVLAIANDLRDVVRTAPETFELGRVVGAALRVSLPSIRDAVAVTTHSAPGALVAGDPGRMCQVFMNLLVNAAEASRGRGSLVPVEVTVERRGDRIVATVRDEGPGIAPEHLPHVLEPLFTTRPTGTGLGLSIVRGIVEEHGGTLTVSSELGSGTRVVVDLPAAPHAPR